MRKQIEDPFVAAVTEYADNVLRYGRDVYGATHTPLFVDGINVDTREPAVWVLSDAKIARHAMPKRSIISNLANHQVLFRMFDALSTLTGDPGYREAAVEAFRFAFENMQHRTGLLYWGGHMCLDLESDRYIGEIHREQPPGEIALTHELKSHFPFYELMWRIDPEATAKFIRSFWANHVVDWETLEFNRHGYYDQSPGGVWDHTYVGGEVPIVTKSMAFMNTGSDLIYSGGMLYRLGGDAGALEWAKKLLSRYDDIRHPETGLAGYQFTIVPGRRIQSQFEEKFGARINESTVVCVSYTRRRYTLIAVSLLRLSEILGPAGNEFRESAVRDLAALARYGYDPEDNAFWAMNYDGLRLSPEDMPKEGYFRRGDLGQHPADGEYLWAYALAFSLGGDAAMWDMTRSIAAGLGLGNWESPGRIEPNLETTVADANVLHALVDLYRGTKNGSFLCLAERIAENVIESRFHKGFFVPSERHLYASFADNAPLAMLYLAAARSGVELPPSVPGKSSFQCDHEGLGRTTDKAAIYARTRDAN